MSNVIIQNNIIEGVIDADVQEMTQDMFKAIIRLDQYDKLSKDIAESMIAELAAQSFMTVDLELTDKQKDVLKGAVNRLVELCVGKFVSNIKKDERTKEIANIVIEKCTQLVERTLRDIGQEVNRGCIINSVAVKADAKNDNYNTIELRHGKRSGDITVPTKGIFISTNCVELIKDSIAVKNEEENEEEN